MSTPISAATIAATAARHHLAIGGAGTIKGGLVAAMILGIADVAGKYYVPEIGSFIIYFLMVALMIAFPAGLYGRRT